ncbi:MAG: DUF2336 domain-containing protein [Pseudomonadota bacterium]
MFIERVIERLDHFPIGERAKGLNALARSVIYSDLDGNERTLIERTLIGALDSPSPLIRRAIADAFAGEPLAPRHMVHMLAHDQLAVSEPILLYSPLLTNAQLIELIAKSEEDVRIAIAAREHLDVSVADAIADQTGIDACMTLLRNPHALLRIEAVARIAERHGRDADLRSELLERPDLPSDIRHSLVDALGHVLKDLVVDREWMPEPKIVSIVDDATEKAVVLLLDHQDPDDVEALLRQFHEDGRLNAQLLLRALCFGNLGIVEGGIALLSGQPRNRVFALLMHGSKSSFAGLLKRCGVAERLVPVFQTALDTYRGLVAETSFDDARQFAQLMVERTLTSYDMIADEDAEDLLNLLRHFEVDIARDSARRTSTTEISVAA